MRTDERTSRRARIRIFVRVGCFGILIPAVILLGVTVFRDRVYNWISLCVALLACLPFFLSFERGRTNTGRVVILAVMVALSVLGRSLFAGIPFFKPVTAMVVIAGIYLGAECGFLCGALSALLSNMLFGQGPWTPFQMLSWGVIGLLAALLAKPLKKSRLLLCLFGIFAGFLFSMGMDVWTTFSLDGFFRLSRYLALTVNALPVTVTYAVSNVVFLLLLARPIGEKLARVITKYGI